MEIWLGIRGLAQIIMGEVKLYLDGVIATIPSSKKKNASKRAQDGSLQI